MDVIATVRSRLNSTLALGYSSAGVVLEVGSGVNEFAVGDPVACAGVDHASHAEMNWVPKNLCVKIPPNVNFDSAASVALGAIALQGVRISEARLGEHVAVIGLGLVGQLVDPLHIHLGHLPHSRIATMRQGVAGPRLWSHLI